VSAADRLRNDPVETAPVPQRKAQPATAARLSGEQRAVAKYIAKSYRVAYESVSHFVQHAYQAAREFRLDPHLILAVMAVESSFDPHAENASGAQGLMQVLTRVHTGKFDPYGGVDAAWEPVANIRVGARILSEYVGRYGDVAAGLKAYVGAALLANDGGYGSKVLKRQAEFDAVLRPPEPAIIETADNAAAGGGSAGGSIGVAGSSATAGTSGRSSGSLGF
jgi:soluble lytic murein transglycosylase-like protein